MGASKRILENEAKKSLSKLDLPPGDVDEAVAGRAKGVDRLTSNESSYCKEVVGVEELSRSGTRWRQDERERR